MKRLLPHHHTILVVAGIAIWLLFGLSYAAIRFNIYYTLPWFDNLMHFLGGAVAALVVYVIAARFRLRFMRQSLPLFLWIVLGVIAVGTFWEVAEFLVNYYVPTYDFDSVDTATDLVADTLGAVLSALLLIRHTHKHHHEY